MMQKNKHLEEGKWIYSFDVMKRINNELILKSKDYLGEEDMLNSELLKFNELSIETHQRIEQGLIKISELSELIRKLNRKKELSKFYFACYQKLRNRLKFEQLFFDESDNLDIEKCEAYLLFEKRLEHNVAIVEEMLGRAKPLGFIQLEDFEVFCYNFRSLLLDPYLVAIDELIVEFRINIYETLERIAKLENEEAFRTNFIEELRIRVKNLKLTAEYYEHKVLKKEALGAFYVRSKAYFF